MHNSGPGNVPINDAAALAIMGQKYRDALRRGETPSIRKIAREVAVLHVTATHSVDSVAERLRGKFRRLMKDPAYASQFTPTAIAQPVILVDTVTKLIDAMTRPAIQQLSPESDAAKCLADFSTYMEQHQRYLAISGRYNEVTAKIAAIKDAIFDLNRKIAEQVDDAVRLALEGRELPRRVGLENDLEQWQFEQRALFEAMVKQSRVVEQVRGEAMLAMLEDATPEHRRLVTNILHAAKHLADAIDAENDFRKEVGNRGVTSFGRWPRLDMIANAIGSRRHFGSLVNRLDRSLSEYLGSAWDYSKVRH